MTKAEDFDKARRLAYKGDFSLVEKLYHPDCKHFDHRVGLEVKKPTEQVNITSDITLGFMRDINDFK